MLTIDNIREITYQANYEVTKKSLELYPELNNDEFWKCKINKLFPLETYLDFYTGEENYLIRDRKDFILAIDTSDGMSCENSLFEYDKMLDDILELSDEKIHTGMGYLSHRLLHIHIKHQFVIVNEGLTDVTIINQCDSELEAKDIIKGHIKDMNYDLNDDMTEYIKYMVIDLNTITPYFLKLGKLRKSIKSKFNVYEISNFS